MSDSGQVVTLNVPMTTVTPGTDFVVFATGGGANVEDMPSYLSDPQRQTGNLPGIARSSFNNRAIRQGAFVAAGVSTFIWEVLLIYQPDDGDLNNWVANFKAALQQFITPGGTLPGGPYLPIAGGTMYGDILFMPGVSLVLPNNTWLRARDTAGNPHGMLMKGNDNNHYINDGSATYVYIGGIPAVQNGYFWSARDTGGTVHGLLAIQGDNNTYLNAYNSLYVTTPNAFFSGNVLIPNNRSYYGSNSSNAPIGLLTVATTNEINIAAGATNNTHIYCGPTFSIILHGPTFTGALTASSATVSGALTVSGTTTLNGALGAYGAANFYSHLNVNNSAGATITGELDTNALHIIGGWLIVDSNSTLNGTTSAQYITIRNPGGSDPLVVNADAGQNARARFIVAGVRAWSFGCVSGGQFGVTDDSGIGWRYLIDTVGHTMWGTLTVTSSISSSGNITAAGTLVAGGILSVLNGAGANVSGVVTCGGFHTTGNAQIDGGININSTAQISGPLYAYSNAQVQGSLVVFQTLQVNSTTQIYGVIYGYNDLRISGNTYISGLTTTNGVMSNRNMNIYDATGNYGITGLGITTYNPVVELQLYPGGNTWVMGHNTAASYILSFNQSGKSSLDQFGNWYAQTFNPGSDRSIKQNIRPFDEDALSIVMRLAPVFFEYKEGSGFDEDTHIGFVGQDVQEVLPEAVRVNPSDDKLALDYNAITTVLLKSAQQMSDKIDALTARIKELEAAA